ncbi:MAG: glutathionylspermidine synthase family protein, partial [Cyanobacteria bacterium J06600_6]
MKGIKVARRRNWQQHVRDNAYQADVLSDLSQEYWIEAISQPFAVQFSKAEEKAIVNATEALGEMCVEFLDWFFTEEEEGEVDRRLASLKIPSAYWQALKLSWDRIDPVEDLALCTRYDLALTETGEVKLLEINAETPLLGAEMVYQWNWYVDYLKNQQQSKYPLPHNSEQFNEYWELVAGQWRKIVEDYDLRSTGISF